METFDDGGRVDEVSPAQHAHEVRVELGDLYPGRPMHVERREQQSCVEENNRTNILKDGEKESEREQVKTICALIAGQEERTRGPQSFTTRGRTIWGRRKKRLLFV